KKVYRFVFLAFGYQHLEAAVDLLGCAVQIADLQKSSPDFQQIVISIPIQLDQAEEGPLGIVHHSRRQVSSTKYGQQLDVAGISFKRFAKDVDRAIDLTLLRVNRSDRGERLPAVGVYDDGFEVGVERLLAVALAHEFRAGHHE